MLIKQVKYFLKEKEYGAFKINDDLNSKNYPESYKFLEEKENKWEYGRVIRDKRKVLKIFDIEAEALMYFIMETYEITLNIELQKKMLNLFDEQLKENQREFIINISKEEDLDIEELKVLNETQLIYKDSLIIDNEDIKFTPIEEFYLLSLYEIKTIKVIQKELVEYGIDKTIVDKYFNFSEKYKIDQEIRLGSDILPDGLKK